MTDASELFKDLIPRQQQQGDASALFADLVPAKKTEPITPPEIQADIKASPLPESMQRFGALFSKSAMKFLTGPVQTLMDTLDPEAGQEFSNFMNKGFQHLEKYNDGSYAAIAGEITGAAAPLALGITGTAGKASMLANAMRGAATGAGIGATGYSEEATPEGRSSERVTGALVGAGVGGAATFLLDPIAKIVTRSANKGEIKNLVGAIDSAIDKTGVHGLGTVQNVISNAFTRQVGKYRELQGSLLSQGEKVTVPETVRSTLSDAFNEATSRLGKSKGKASVVLDKIGKEFASSGIAAKAKFTEGPETSQFVKDQIAKALKDQPFFKGATYSGVRRAYQDVDGLLKSRAGKGLQDAEMGALKDVRDNFLVALRGMEKDNPALKRTAARVDTFRKENLDFFDHPDVKTFLSARTNEQRADAITKSIMSGDKEVSDKFYEILGPAPLARAKVGARIANYGLLDAKDAVKGEIDPAKFSKFFEELDPRAKRFIDPAMSKSIDGIKNFLSDSAIRRGQAMSPQISQGLEHAGEFSSVILGLREALTGHVVRGLMTASGGLGVHSIVRGINNMLESAVGRNFLAASARTKPGTPRYAKLASAIESRFIAPAANEIAEQFKTEGQQQQ